MKTKSKEADNANTPENYKRATEIKAAIKKFGVQMRHAENAIYEMSKIFAEMYIKYDGYALRMFHAVYPSITKAKWNRMLKIADGTLVPEVLLLTDKAAGRFGKMSIAEQRKILGGKKTIKVVAPNGSVIDKPLTAVHSHDVNALFADDGHVRTIEEQIQWNNERVAKKSKSMMENEVETGACENDDSRVAAYDIVDGSLVVHRPVVIGKRELMEILLRM